MREVVKPKKGKATRRTREKLHPRVNAKARPAKVMEKARIIVPIFSPKAFWMAPASLVKRAESSEGLIVSNHALSCLKIDSRYLTLIFLTTRSLNRRRREYRKYEVIQMAIPTHENIRDILLIVSTVSSGLVVGLNESMTSPMRNTKEGIPNPVMLAESQPKYIRSLSEVEAKQ